MIASPPRPASLVLHNVSWDAYERLVDAAGESHARFTYDDGDLEIMTLSFAHDNAGRWIGRLIAILALDLNIPLRTGGSTTLKESLKKKGLEPDESFWIKNHSQMRGKKQWTSADPPPDLVVEVDVTHSSLDRIGIYAALGVPEIWHFDGKTFKVLVLGKRGKHRRSTTSQSFPTLPIAEFARFVTELETVDDETELLREFRKWVRDKVMD